MIIDWSEQGSEAWLKSRLGVITASELTKIMTPGGKASSQAMVLMHKLNAEWLIGEPAENKTYGMMEHGKATEALARDTYEFITGNALVETGVIYKDSGKLVGCSPDAMLCDVPRGTEIKCPDRHTHVGYLGEGCCPSKYLPQVQGSMYVTGYESWDFMSFHPDFPPLIVTVARDNDYITSLDNLIQKFKVKMIKKRKQLERYKL